MPVDEHGEGAVVPGARGGRQPEGDLTLDHDGDALKAARLNERGQQGGGHAVGQVGADHGPEPCRAGAHDPGQVEPGGVAPDDLYVIIPAQRLAQYAAQGAVQLYGDDLPGAHDDDPVRDLHDLIELVGDDDEAFPRHGGLDEEVLAQGLGEAEAVPFEQGLYFSRAREIHLAYLAQRAVPIAVEQALCSGTK